MFYIPDFKKKTALILIFILAGSSIGLWNHLWQDSIYYSKEKYIDSVVYLKPHDTWYWKDALCSAIYSDFRSCDPEYELCREYLCPEK